MAADNVVVVIISQNEIGVGPIRANPANTVRNITFMEVPFSSFMDERNEDVLGT